MAPTGSCTLRGNQHDISPTRPHGIMWSQYAFDTRDYPRNGGINVETSDFRYHVMIDRDFERCRHINVLKLAQHFVFSECVYCVYMNVFNWYNGVFGWVLLMKCNLVLRNSLTMFNCILLTRLLQTIIPDRMHSTSLPRVLKIAYC